MAVINNKTARKMHYQWVIALLFSLFSLMVATAQAMQVTDITGRKVEVPAKVERILLGEGRLIYALALLEGEQTFRRIVGWQGDMRKIDQQNYHLYQTKFPQIDNIPLIGQTTAESTSSEQALKLNPDIAIFSLSGHGAGLNSELMKQLEKAGVPVVFVDFRLYPMKNTLPSIKLLGTVLQRQAEAEKYIAFYQQELDKVRRVVEKVPQDKRPKVFIDLKAGYTDSCCSTAGKGNMGEMIELAGGQNIARDLLPTELGEINLEKVLVTRPDVYIATGANNPDARTTGLKMGASVSGDLARRSLKTVLQRKGISSLKAVRQGRAHGIWHSFYNSPYNVVAVQVIAKWLYPEQFQDLDPQQTLRQLHSQFLPVETTGTYWTSLKEE